ncbi:hypothetical protein ACHAP8_009584 [Fusarium lateritium]
MCLSTESAEFKAKTKETYWPILKSSLLNGDLRIEDLDLDCPICWDNMSVPTGDEHADDHEASILPCGHIIGKSCARIGQLKACPSCRAEIVHSDCRHPVGGKTVPGSIKMINSVPQVLSKGGCISSSCRDCQLHSRLEDLLQEFIEMDEESQTRKGLHTRRLGISLRAGGRYLSIGDCPNGMKPVSIDTPKHIRMQWRAFEEGQIFVANEGLEWFDDPIENTEILCFTFQMANMAAIMDIYHHIDAYSCGDNKGNEDEDDSSEDDSSEDDYDEEVASWQILLC